MPNSPLGRENSTIWGEAVLTSSGQPQTAQPFFPGLPVSVGVSQPHVGMLTCPGRKRSSGSEPLTLGSTLPEMRWTAVITEMAATMAATTIIREGSAHKSVWPVPTARRPAKSAPTRGEVSAVSHGDSWVTLLTRY